jgi:hypothetical protein
MEEKILVICPSRGRPAQCREMVDSFLATSKMSSLRLCLDNDDPQLDQYREGIRGRVSYTISIQNTITNLINDNWKYSADCFKWFCVTNDDFVYRSEGWDEKLIASLKAYGGGTGIVYGNDLLQGVHMPTTSIVSRDIVEALGWLQMPRLIHLFGDNVWKHLGQRAECLYYRPDVIIEHKHFYGGKAVEDEIYKRTNARSMYDADKANFIKWLYAESPGDIEKVKALVEKNRPKPALEMDKITP